MVIYPTEQTEERRRLHSLERRENQERMARHFEENKMQGAAAEPEGDQEGMR